MRYDYFVAGRWRNHKNIRKALKTIRNSDKTAYCFIDNAYDGDGVWIDTAQNADVESFMKNLETTENWQNNPTFRKIYENDMDGLRNSKEMILVFPAGLSGHMELGVAFGMGKKCYGIGKPEKYETLYLMLEDIFPDIQTFLKQKTAAAT